MAKAYYKITLIYQLLQEIISPPDNNNKEVPAVPEAEFDLSNWQSGVEQFECWLPEQLWHVLGRDDHTLPYFNCYEDPTGEINPWSKEFEEWMKEQLASAQPEGHTLTPR